MDYSFAYGDLYIADVRDVIKAERDVVKFGTVQRYRLSFAMTGSRSCGLWRDVTPENDAALDMVLREFEDYQRTVLGTARGQAAGTMT